MQRPPVTQFAASLCPLVLVQCIAVNIRPSFIVFKDGAGNDLIRLTDSRHI